MQNDSRTTKNCEGKKLCSGLGMANGKDKTYYEIEIKRVKNALKNTESEYLKRDYTKYLKRLLRERKRFAYGKSKYI